MFGGHLDDAERQIDDWQAGIEANAARARQLGEDLRALRGEGADAQGWVRVTVDPAGRLLTLDISERVKGWPMRRIAEAVLEASRAAHENVAALSRAAIARAGLPDDEAGLGL